MTEGTLIGIQVNGQPVGRVNWPYSNHFLSPKEIEATIAEHWLVFKEKHPNSPPHCFLDVLTDHGFEHVRECSDMTVNLA